MKAPISKFIEIPAISILNGSIVITHGESYETLTIENKVPDALDLIEIITEEYETIFLMDINGLTEGKPQIKMIKEITDFCEVWLDAGVVEAESVYDLFVAGAHEVVLASKTLDSLMEMANAFELSENLIFEIDYSDAIISHNQQIRDMTPAKLVSELKDIGIERVIFADIGRIEMNKTIEKSIIQSILKLGAQVYVGGGIKLSDVSALKQIGASGAIIELKDVLQHGRVDL